jgi:phosphoribosylaminoimidazole carboxylase PurE protein
MNNVCIVMGSDSDLPIMQEAKTILDNLNISNEIRIYSAHRTPVEVKDYITQAEKNGCQVFIAGAGLAAHLAGAVAAHSVRPVIGVPLDAGSLGGLDALLSTVQMPAGIPVATVAIGKAGAKNAGWLAAQILSLSNPELSEKIKQARKENGEKLLQKNQQL